MPNLNEREKRRVVSSVTHQGIGGKEIIIEREMTCKDLSTLCTIAVWNFLKRRPDLREYENRNTPIYYGHVQSKDGSWLGYFVAADELEECVDE